MLELKRNGNCVSFGSELSRRHRSVTHFKLKQTDIHVHKDMADMC